MTRLEITISATARKTLRRVTMSDGLLVDRFNIQAANLAAASLAGDRAVLGLVAAKCGPDGADMAEAAILNGSPVWLNGRDVGLSDFRAAFSGEQAVASAAAEAEAEAEM